MTEPRLILSTSSMSSYLRCRYMYLLSSVYRVPGAQSMAAVLGIAVHAAVEALWTSPKRPETALRASFATELTQVPRPYEEPPEAALADGVRMLGTYMTKVAPTFKPTMVEERFLITVDDVALSGVIDQADDDDVHDLKTVSMISKFHPEDYVSQLSLYSIGYKAMTGRAPRRLLLDVLPRGGRVAYRQIEVQPEIGELMDVVGVVSDGIIGEDYEPTGATNGACHWCAYKSICQFAKDD